MKEIIGVRKIAQYLGASESVVSAGWHKHRLPVGMREDGKAYSYDVLLDAAKPLLLNVRRKGVVWHEAGVVDELCRMFVYLGCDRLSRGNGDFLSDPFASTALLATELAVSLQLMPGELWYDGAEPFSIFHIAADAAFAGCSTFPLLSRDPYKCRFCGRDNDWIKRLPLARSLEELDNVEWWTDAFRSALSPLRAGTEAAEALRRPLGDLRQQFVRWFVYMATTGSAAQAAADLPMAPSMLYDGVDKDRLEGMVDASVFFYRFKTRKLALWAFEMREAQRYLPDGSKYSGLEALEWILKANPRLQGMVRGSEPTVAEARAIWLKAAQMIDAGKLKAFHLPAHREAAAKHRADYARWLASARTVRIDAQWAAVQPRLDAALAKIRAMSGGKSKSLDDMTPGDMAAAKRAAEEFGASLEKDAPELLPINRRFLKFIEQQTPAQEPKAKADRKAARRKPKARAKATKRKATPKG